jgi:DNA uptake protein ComE-like DNA-binding protein
VLAVVLVLVGLVAVAVGSFIFFARAETSGTVAQRDVQQARLAAESGLEELIAVLRTEKHNSGAWFDVPARFRHALVWSDHFDRENDPVRKQGSRADLLKTSPIAPAWRYSIVAPSDSGLPDTMRYGVTPESSRLNLNAATDAQIESLLLPLLTGLQIENAGELINALLDWRDADEDPRDGGAENEYYNTLEPPYNCKNGRFDTLEELLLVKGFTPAVLWGEDTNRNGILDENEDDGEASFPAYDNGDGVLNPGVAPFLTVWSREPDTALDNQRRIYLGAGGAATLAQAELQLEEDELSAATLQFLGGLSPQQGRRLRSPADLYTVPDESEPETPGEEGEEGGAASQPAGLPDSPVTLDELPTLMDRFTTHDPQSTQQGIEGLININTAPAQVLALIPGITPEAVASIVATREQLDPEAMQTTAWPLVSGAVGVRSFQAIAPYITTKAYQFRVEVLGYADHARLARRYEWVIEMRGPLAQILYHRDLTSLGFAWPIDNDDALVTKAR